MTFKDMKIVFLFSGQGSHYRGMGKTLFDNNTVFRDSLKQSAEIVEKHLHRSLIDELYKIKSREFDDLLITHPAIVAVEIAMYHMLQAMNIKSDYVTGYSLGEFAACVASGVWSPAMAIEACIEQAKCIVRNGVPGGMVAVICPRTEHVEQLYRSHNLHLAADNFQGHFTLSGCVADLEVFQKALDNVGYQSLRLPVSFPFHSPLIDDARHGFSYYMNSITPLSNPAAGFISCLKCEELKILPENYFWDIASEYTNFPNLVKYTENKGPCLYIDLGPSGTMASFVKYNLNAGSLSQTFPIMTGFGREENQLEALQKLMDEGVATG